MTRAARVGDLGLDFAQLPATYPKMYQDGARFWCRYSKGDGAGSSDFETNPGEIAAAVNAGGDFFANYERAEHTPEQGAAMGRSEGEIDRDFWQRMGLQPGAGVIVSWEPGAPPTPNGAAELAVAKFLDNYSNAVGRPPGTYMPLGTMLRFRKSGLTEFTWLPMSSYVSGIDTSNMDQPHYAAKMLQVARDNGINLCQTRNRRYGNGADEDIYTNDDHIPFSHLQVKGAFMTQPLTAAQTQAACKAAMEDVIRNTQFPSDYEKGLTHTIQDWLAVNNFRINHDLSDAVTGGTAAVLAALKVVPAADVDETALANALVPILVPALAAQLPQVSEGQLETALRSIFRSVPAVAPQPNG